jgi:hypothetical protein
VSQELDTTYYGCEGVRWAVMIALFPLAHTYISAAFRVRNSVPLRCLNEEFDFTFIARIFLSAGPAEWPAEYESAEYI